MNSACHKSIYSLRLIALVFTALAVLMVSGCELPAYAVANIVARSSPEETARSIAHGPGMYPGDYAYEWGDRLLEPLRNATSNFTKVNRGNAYMIAEVLAHNKSAASAAVSSELFHRDDILQRLIGAVGLAAQQKLPRAEFTENGIIGHALIKYSKSTGPFLNTCCGPDMLALLAVKYARSKDSVPPLCAVLKIPHAAHREAADTLAAIGDRRAIPALREVMKDPDFKAKYAVFKALIALSDDQAIPLAFNNIRPSKDGNSYAILKELKAMTGQDFGFDKEKWQQWWSAQQL